MKTLPPLFIFVLFAFTSFSQGLEIYIDATTGKSTFVSGKDTLEKPQVKRGESIDLYLLNYNNYLYEIEIEESQRQTVYATGMDTSQLSGLSKSPGGGSALDLMSVIMNPAGLLGMNPLAQGQLSFLGGLSFGSKGFAVDEQEALVLHQLEDLEFKYEEVLGELAQTENSLQAIQQDVEHLVNAKAIQSMATEEIRKLQYNPNLSVTQIKKLSDEYLKMVFSNTPADQIDMDYLWKIHQKGQEINLHLKNIEAERANYNAKLMDIQTLALSITPLKDKIRSPKVMDVYNQIDQSMKSSLQKGEKEKIRLEAAYEALSGAIEVAGPEDFQDLINLRYTYEEILSNDFTYKYQTNAKEDLTELTIKLNPKENLPSNVQVSSRKLATYQIPTRGGLKINGSVGLGFGQFFSRPESYFVRDSVILSEHDDSFVPYLASFLHFYPYHPNQLAFGGSFGVGIPVFNTQNEQSMAFFLGPSIFMGGAQRITITGGVLGARVQALSSGYAVGDVLDAPALGIPTTGRYKLGYFLSVSINFLGN